MTDETTTAAAAPADAPKPAPAKRARRPRRSPTERKLLVATKPIRIPERGEPVPVGTLIDAGPKRWPSLERKTRPASKTDEVIAGPQRLTLD